MGSMHENIDEWESIYLAIRPAKSASLATKVIMSVAKVSLAWAVICNKNVCYGLECLTCSTLLSISSRSSASRSALPPPAPPWAPPPCCSSWQNCEASGFSIEEGTSLAVFSRALAVSSSRISRSSCFRPLVMAGRSAWTKMINLRIHES